jgi:hypothetical protein
MRAELMNAKKSCTAGEIIAGIEKGILKESDLCVMHVLYVHHYMTRHSLTDNIRYDGAIPQENKRKNYKQCIAKLVKFGIVLRYGILWDGEDGAVHSTPCFYMLSRHAYEYIGRAYRYGALMKRILHFEFNAMPEVREILEASVFNQFHAQLLKLHRGALSNFYVNLGIKANKGHANVRGVYSFYTERVPSKRVNIVAVAVRSQKGWMESLDRQVACIEGYAQKENALFTEPLYVFICESGEHARIVDRFLMGRHCMPYLYIIDQSLFEGDILGRMFRIEDLGEGNYRLVLQALNL